MTIGSDLYERASFIPKLQETRTMVLSDQDGTNTVNSSDVDSPRELQDRAAACALMEKKGVVTGTVTARTMGLTISEKSRLASIHHGYNEPVPLWKKNAKGKHVYIDPAKVPFFRDSLDRDISGCFGSGILLRNGRGYMPDLEYDDLLNYDFVRGSTEQMSPERWRNAIFLALTEAFPDFIHNLADIESRSNYEKGDTNVAPLRFRVQFNFKGPEGLLKLRELQSVIERGAPTSRLLARIEMVDESHPCKSDPEKSRYTLYLVPRAGTKERMINWLVGKSAKAAKLEPNQMKILYAGDTLTDLRAGLYGGGNAEVVFLLATGSRLAPYIMGREPMFGNESLDFLWSNTKRPQDRLRATGDGVYTFNLSGGYKRPNRVVVGDERYPGLTPPGSVHTFLKEYL